jgi:hypothetical protein
MTGAQVGTAGHEQKHKNRAMDIDGSSHKEEPSADSAVQGELHRRSKLYYLRAGPAASGTEVIRAHAEADSKNLCHEIALALARRLTHDFQWQFTFDGRRGWTVILKVELSTSGRNDG